MPQSRQQRKKEKEYVLEPGSEYSRARVEGKVLTETESAFLTEDEVMGLQAMGVKLVEKSAKKEGEE